MSRDFAEPVPLAAPDASPQAVRELATELTGAAFRLGVLQAHLAGPAAAVPGWLGRDAAAAGDQITAVVDLTAHVRVGLAAGADRLEAHARLLDDVTARLAVLRRRQEADFAETRARLLVADGSRGDFLIGPDPAQQALAELHAAEADRARAHAALLAEVEDDAVATARVLASGSGAVGGTGRPGDADRVLAHLAGILPGWGAPELARRAAELVARLGGPVDVRGVADAARAALPFATAPAFAAAFVSDLGADGLGWLLTLVGEGQASSDGEVVRLLAGVLGAAPPAGGGDLVQGVLDEAALDPDDPDPVQDLIAIGMGEVLAVAFARPGTSGRPALLTAWGGSILQREGTLRRTAPGQSRAVERISGMRPGPVPDPAQTVVELLAREQDDLAAASVLATPETWGAVLGRSWAADDDPLSQVIRLVGEGTGPVADHSLMTGLGVLGAGLSDGVPDGWDVDRGTVSTVSPAFGAAVGTHADLAAGLLTAAANGQALSGPADAALRALGVLARDAEATTSMQAGLQQWASGQSVSPEGCGATVGPAVAGPAGFVAVREYGQRLAYALHGFEARGRAAERQADWNLFVVVPVNVLPGAAAEVASKVEPFIAHAIGTDGTWQNGVDAGARFTPDAAVAITSAQLTDGQRALAPELDQQARAAYLATATRLGAPAPPDSPVWDPTGPMLDAGPGLDDAQRLIHNWEKLRRVPR